MTPPTMECVVDTGAPIQVATLSHRAFKTWRATDGKAAHELGIAHAQAFIRHPSVLFTKRWLDIFPCVPPWGEIERIARELSTELHVDAMPWLYNDEAEYLAEVVKVKHWFMQVLPGTRRNVGIARETEGEAATPNPAGGPHPCATPAILEIFQRCEEKTFLQGCFNWSYSAR
jgi:hypothetical protein